MARNKCPTCGMVETLKDGTTELSTTFGAQVFVATVPAEVCGTCGEAIVTSATLGAYENTVTRALIASGASDGKALKWVRKSAGLTGVELARLLGVAPETVSRWENNAQVPDRAAVALLGALALDALEGRTTTRDHLDALARAVTAAVVPARVVLQVLPSAA